MTNDKRRNIRIIVTSFLFGFVIVIIFIGIEFLNPLLDPSTPLNGKMSDVNKLALDLIIDSTKLFMTWSIALIGAIGYFIKSYIEKNLVLSKWEIIFCEGTIVLLLFSLFYGHLIIENLITMLSFDVFNPQDSTLISYIRLHYMFFMSSLVFLVVSINYLVFNRNKGN